MDNQIFTPYLHKNHASYGPISRARYDLYQFLIYNALLVSRRRLNKERVSVKADNPFDLLLPAAMAKVAEEAGVYKATKHPLKTFYLAITAGVFISIAFVFYITATTGTGTMPFGMAKLVGGICFSLGLILCVVCGADLFTSTVLIVVAKASGRITRVSWRKLAKCLFWQPGRRTAVCTFNVAFRRVYDRKWSMGTKRPTNRRPQSAPYFY